MDTAAIVATVRGLVVVVVVVVVVASCVDPVGMAASQFDCDVGDVGDADDTANEALVGSSARINNEEEEEVFPAVNSRTPIRMSNPRSGRIRIWLVNDRVEKICLNGWWGQSFVLPLLASAAVVDAALAAPAAAPSVVALDLIGCGIDGCGPMIDGCALCVVRCAWRPSSRAEDEMMETERRKRLCADFGSGRWTDIPH